MDRFQEVKEDVERQKALVKLLIDNIGKSTKALAALQNFMKRASVPQSVAEFNRKLIRISNTVSEACAMAAQFGQTAEGDANKKSTTTTSGSQQQGGGNDKRGNNHTNTKEEKSARGNTTSTDVDSDIPTCNHCGWRNHATSECSLATHKRANPRKAEKAEPHIKN